MPHQQQISVYGPAHKKRGLHRKRPTFDNMFETTHRKNAPLYSAYRITPRRIIILIVSMFQKLVISASLPLSIRCADYSFLNRKGCFSELPISIFLIPVYLSTFARGMQADFGLRCITALFNCRGSVSARDRVSFSLEARFRSAKGSSGTKLKCSKAAFSLSAGCLYRASARERYPVPGGNGTTSLTS